MSGFMKTLEAAAVGDSVTTEALISHLQWNQAGLIPAVAQDAGDKQVLMLAWMNQASLRETLATRRACYYSRSRGGLWRKGETSGHVQQVQEIRTDCDGDTLLLMVKQTGPACHTGRRSCFYVQIGETVSQVTAPVDVDPTSVYGTT